jgi:hypothetical protein
MAESLAQSASKCKELKSQQDQLRTGRNLQQSARAPPQPFRQEQVMRYRTESAPGVALTVLLGVALAAPHAMAADQTLDWNGVESAASSHFTKLDKDGDGTLSWAARPVTA